MIIRISQLMIGLLLAVLPGRCQQQDKEWLTKNPPATLLSGNKRFPVSGNYYLPGAKPMVPVNGGAANRPASTAFIYPLQECFTYTFRLKIGEAGSKTFITGTTTTKNGETYTVGYSIDGAGNTKGVIQQIGHTGDIGWTRTVSFANRQVMLKSIRQLPNGNLVVIGNYQGAVPADKQLLIAQISEDGLLIWCKSFNVPELEGVAVCSDRINGIGFAGQRNQQMVYGRLDNGGNLVWLKQLLLMDHGNVAGMENDAFYNWYIAYSGVQAGVHIGILLSINPVNGELRWNNQYGGGATNQQFVFTELAIANSRPRIVGVFSSGTSAYAMCKVTVNEGSGTDYMQVFEVPSVLFDTTALVSIDARGEVLAFVANNTDPDIYAIKTIPEAAVDTLWNWAKKFTVAGNHHFVHAQQTFDAGLIIATDLPAAAGTIQAQVLKTDSSGKLTNCEGTDFIFYNNRVAQNSVPNAAVAVDLPALLVVENPLVGPDVLPLDFSCKTLTCPVQAPEDSCLTSFARRFKSVGFCDLGNDLLPQSSEVIFTGLMRNDAVRSDDQEGILGRLDSQGKLLDRKKIKLGNNTAFTQLLQLTDGNFVVMGNSAYHFANGLYDSGYITLSKFTPSLQLVWTRAFSSLEPNFIVAAVLEGTDGSLFLKYVAGSDIFCLKTGLIKLDSQGNQQWIQEYTTTSRCVIGNTGSMTQDDQYIYLVNWTNGDASERFIKIDKNTGLPVLTSGLLMPDAYQWRTDGRLAELGEKIVMGGTVSFTNGSSSTALMLINKNGAVVKNKCFSLLSNPVAFTMVITRNQEIVMTGGDWVHTFFIRLDSNLNILYSKKIISYGVGERAIKEDAGGAILSTGYFTYNDPYKLDFLYRKFTYDGKLGSCFTDSLLVDTASYPVNHTQLTTLATAVSLNQVVLPYNETSYSLQNAQLLCGQVSGCSTINLNAPTSLCDSLVYVARVSRNAGCSLPVSFTQSNANLKIVSSTDSTVSFKMIQSGSTMLVASVFTGCIWLRDTVVINSSIGGGPVDLGNDTSICTGNSIVLRVRKNYFSYQWNDGSTADTLQLTIPGTYFVNVTDACGHILSDTILINAAPPVAISIGPDKIKCNDEQVLLAAPAGFISYSWGPSYNLIAMSDSQVNVFPQRDTSYFIQAEKTPGCFAFDTVAIKVNQSPVIELGTDKSFCSGDSIELNAGNGFDSYSWNTGAVSQKIMAFAEGIYTVLATNGFGCISKDTLTVLNVFSNPVVQLGNDFSLCSGSSKILDAGAFNEYLWNNLSTDRTLQVNRTGIYTVQVTDQNNCVGKDSVVVAAILPLPAAFLPADTTLCQYETIQLTASSNFSSYTWRTGSLDKILSAKAPNTYWLLVKDANNCMGTDSITIGLKPCIAGFYIPSAFTPNNDGKNYFFKPVLFGNVLQYHFLIYNRYGQLIFETNDFTKGWNGKVNGSDQNTNGFSWICHYQLEGSAAKTEKGNMILVR